MQDNEVKKIPDKTIVVKAETYQALTALKMIPQEPFDSVIRKLLNHNKDLIES